MKQIPPLLAFAAFAVQLSGADTNAPAPQKIGTADAAKYYDQTMIVTGKVAQVTIRPTVTFLNLDKAYPDSPFTAVIFHGHSSFYGDANALRGKSIEIKGKIQNYRDKPEIALDSTNQLTRVRRQGREYHGHHSASNQSRPRHAETACLHSRAAAGDCNQSSRNHVRGINLAGLDDSIEHCAGYGGLSSWDHAIKMCSVAVPVASVGVTPTGLRA